MGRKKGSKNKNTHRYFKDSFVSTIKLKCKKCKKPFEIRTTTLEAYTEQVKQNWKCLSCENKKESRK